MKTDFQLSIIIKANLDWFRCFGITKTIDTMLTQGLIEFVNIKRITELYLYYELKHGIISEVKP